jgi:hypothetical protein
MLLVIRPLLFSSTVVCDRGQELFPGVRPHQQGIASFAQRELVLPKVAMLRKLEAR